MSLTSSRCRKLLFRLVETSPLLIRRMAVMTFTVNVLVINVSTSVKVTTTCRVRSRPNLTLVSG